MRTTTLLAIGEALLCVATQVDNRVSAAAPLPWDQIVSVPMQGDWKAFWNVEGGDAKYNDREATSHGFQLVTLVRTYSDYPGTQKENIGRALKSNRTNPWKKPEFFERIVRRNIAEAGRGQIMVHDIEFSFVAQLL